MGVLSSLDEVCVAATDRDRLQRSTRRVDDLPGAHPGPLFAQRRQLLDYVKKHDDARYKTLIERLGIRR